MGVSDEVRPSGSGRGAASPPGALRYRGDDRRGLVPTPRTVGTGYLALACLVVLLALIINLGGRHPELDPAQMGRLTTSLDGVALAFACIVAALCIMRWRLVGEAAALQFGVASGVYATVVLGPSVVIAGTDPAPGALPAAGRIVIAVLVVAAITGPEVDAGVRPSRSFGRAAAGVIGAAFVVSWLPVAADLLLTPGEQLDNGLQTGASGAGATVLWLVLGTWAVLRGQRRRRPLIAWFGLGMIALAAGAATPLWRTADGSMTDLGTVSLQVLALSCICAGAIKELLRAFREKDGRLLASVTTARAAESRLQVDLEVQRERAHEASNVLAAIEAATLALERYRDQLGEDERAELSSSITSEVHRMHQLVQGTADASQLGRFRPSEAIAPLVTCLATQVTDIHVDVPPHLVAVGRAADTVQVIHNVLENARRYGGGRITLTATLHHDQVVLRVTDTGPGIPPGQERSIFERGVRGDTALGTSGSGLGLSISRDLMRDQGGEIRLAAPDRGGGAAFEIALPGFSSLVGDQPVDQLQDLRQAGSSWRSLRLARTAVVQRRVPVRVQEDDPAADVVAS
jgi:signal transduction histidine kinase